MWAQVEKQGWYLFTQMKNSSHSCLIPFEHFNATSTKTRSVPCYTDEDFSNSCFILFEHFTATYTCGITLVLFYTLYYPLYDLLEYISLVWILIEANCCWICVACTPSSIFVVQFIMVIEDNVVVAWGRMDRPGKFWRTLLESKTSIRDI